MSKPGPPRRAALAFIFITVVLDVLALGVVIPVLPKLVEQLLGGDTAHAARIIGLFGTAWALMQFVFSPVIGALSDHFGRRFVILAANFGLGLDYILMALAPNLGWLFIGRIISGITGASFTAAGAYVADVTPPEKRAQGFGLMGAAWGLGFVLGPAMGGLLGEIDPRLPFWVAAALTLVNAAYGLFVLPESLAPEHRVSFDWRRANPMGSLGFLRAHPGLFGLSSVNFLYWLAHQVLQNVFVLYTGYRYGWSARTVGLTLALVGICNIAVQATLVQPIVRRLGERISLMIALAFGAAGYAIYGLAPTGAWFLAGVPVFALIGLFGPSLQGIMTRRVGPKEQGRLQGANASLMGIAGMLGPVLFTFTFSAFIQPGQAMHLPGAAFLLAATLHAAALAVAALVTRPEPAPDVRDTPSLGS